ncbi:uncharacterized protein LOC113848034 [Abrus precatorius]|uniref:Uncharacterized protein LOC113848034 n=1 Tax=Abrus precatorius TaxID=3816 RepID=A0A8B8JRL4_ABRPR|nr:uncharacterized protein LOC113848034 [Abrus precatorius]
MLIQIQRWLIQPKVWRFVCFVSCVVGFICYGLSLPFNKLLGKWALWKILLYVALSFIICIAILFGKAWQHSTPPQFEAHMAFIVLISTGLYSFYMDKLGNKQSDSYSLISYASFSIMSLGLSRLSHFGFEVDLLYFFSGIFTVQLMKIKLWLGIVGGGFSYSLIILRSSLDNLIRNGYHELPEEPQVDIEIGLPSPVTSHSASQGGSTSPQAINSTFNVDPQEAHAPLENEDVGLLANPVDSHSQQGNSDSDRGCCC